MDDDTGRADDLRSSHVSRPWPVDRFFDRDGNPITITAWVHKRRDPAYCLVARWAGSTGDYVRTFWVGLDVNFGADLETTIFETHLRVDGRRHFYRYATEEAALEGHRDVVWFVMRGIKPWDAVAVRAIGGTP